MEDFPFATCVIKAKWAWQTWALCCHCVPTMMRKKIVLTYTLICTWNRHTWLIKNSCLGRHLLANNSEKLGGLLPNWEGTLKQQDVSCQNRNECRGPWSLNHKQNGGLLNSNFDRAILDSNLQITKLTFLSYGVLPQRIVAGIKMVRLPLTWSDSLQLISCKVTCLEEAPNYSSWKKTWCRVQLGQCICLRTMLACPLAGEHHFSSYMPMYHVNLHVWWNFDIRSLFSHAKSWRANRQHILHAAICEWQSPCKWHMPAPESMLAAR